MSDAPGWASPSPGEAPGGPGGPGAPGGPPGWSAPSPQPPPPSWPPAGYGGAPPMPGYGGAPPVPGWGAGWGPPPPPKPGVVPLRPLGVGEILDGAISTIRAHPTIMLGLSAVVAALTQLLLLPVNAVAFNSGFLDPTGGSSAEGLGGSVGGSLAGGLATATTSLVSVLVTLVLSGLLTIVVGRAVLGQGIALKEAWQLTRPRLPALLGAALLIAAVLAVLIALALAPGLVLLASGAPLAASVSLLLVGGLVAGLGSVYLYVSLALGPSAAVLERQPARAALRRSRRLVTGSWWRVFGILLLIQVIAGILASIIAAPFSIGLFVTVFTGGEAGGPLALGLNALGATIAAAVTSPFTAAATTLLYLDLRMRREGLDITLARAAGAQAPAPAPAAYGSPPAPPSG